MNRLENMNFNEVCNTLSRNQKAVDSLLKHMDYELRIQTKEQLKGLALVVYKMKEAEKRVIDLYFIQGKTKSEISKELNTSSTRVNQRLSVIENKLNSYKGRRLIELGYTEGLIQIEKNKREKELETVKKGRMLEELRKGEEYAKKQQLYLEYCGVNTRVVNILNREGIYTLTQLSNYSAEQIVMLYGIAGGTIVMLEDILKLHGLRFR